MESSPNFKYFQKKKVVIANILPNLQTIKDLVRALSKKRRFTTSFDSQHIKASETLLKSPSENFYHILHLSGVTDLQNISISDIRNLRGVVTTLTADDKCPVRDYESFPIPIEMQ